MCDEPHLRETDNLFAEFESWDYAASSNAFYHALIRKIAKIKQSIFEGSKLELIGKANVADYLYVATPRGLLDAAALADGWGLLHIDPAGRQVSVVKEAELCECSGEKEKMHLIQNIAAANVREMLFANGMVQKEAAVDFYMPPRRRRKKIC